MLNKLATSKMRMWLGYALIALVIILAAVTLTNATRIYFMKAHVKALEAQSAALEQQMESAAQANAGMKETVDNLRGLRELDAQVLNSLADRLGTLTRQDSSLRNQLQLLETSNEKARDYLDRPVDAGIQRLLDEPLPPRARRNGNAPGPDDDSVREAAARTVEGEPGRNE